MNATLSPLALDYLAIEKTAEIDSIIEKKFARLSERCDRIQNCKIKIANVARYQKNKTNCSYLISISLSLAEGISLYVLRSPQLLAEDFVESALADAFAKIYRKLIELRFENINLYQ